MFKLKKGLTLKGQFYYYKTFPIKGEAVKDG